MTDLSNTLLLKLETISDESFLEHVLEVVNDKTFDGRGSQMTKEDYIWDIMPTSKEELK